MNSVLQSDVVALSELQQAYPGYTSRTGDTGTGFLVLGHVTDSFRFLVAEIGGSVPVLASVSQTADIGDVQRVRLRGKVRFNEPLADNCFWTLRLAVGANETTFVYSPDFVGQELFLDDIVVQVPAQNVSTTIDLELSYEGATPVEATAPTFVIERFDFEEDPLPFYLGNRYPSPEDRNAPLTANTQVDPTVRFDLWAASGVALDPASVTIWLDADKIYESGAGLDPSLTFIDHGNSSGTVLSLAVYADFDSPYVTRPQDFLHRMRVSARSLTGDEVEESWTWTWRDMTPPAVIDVAARSDSSVVVTFSEPVLMTADLAGALNPGSYALTVQQGEGAFPAPVKTVTAGDTDREVIVTFTEKLTFNGAYDLVVGAQVQDLAGNSMQSEGRSYAFTAVGSNKSDCRSINLYRELPAKNRREDVTGDLRKFVSVIQDWADQAFYSIDCFSDIYDVERAPIEFIDAMLFELGNPFDCVDLSDIQKRRLVPVLISIYQQMGSSRGIENAVRFLMGIEVTVCPMVRPKAWILGRNRLGVDTCLAPQSGSRLYYTFRIKEFDTLTDEQKETLRCIVDIMKPIHEHLFEEPIAAGPGEPEPEPEPEPEAFWEIEDPVNGVLGVTTILSQ